MDIKKAFFTGLVILCFLLAPGIQAEEGTAGSALLDLLPDESRLRGWNRNADPETAEGNALYELINGGAEMYIREGFKRAVFASYVNGKGKTLNLDIYEMASPGSARAVYRAKTEAGGKPESIGEEALLKEYFLNFRKGRFQVTLSGYDSTPETVEMILHTARLVADRIPPSP